MFGSKFTGRVKESLTDYLDEKFDDYRGQIVADVSKGLAVLAGLVVLLSLGIVCGVFLSIAMAALLGWMLSWSLGSLGYVLSFLLVGVVLFGGSYYLAQNKVRYIEAPIFKIVAKALRSPKQQMERTEPFEPNPAQQSVPLERLPSTEERPGNLKASDAPIAPKE